MINKKLLSFDRKALRYVGLNVLFQWLGMLCNVVLVITVSRLIGGVFADSILIDEARTPLIISGKGEDSSSLYTQVDRFVRTLHKSVVVDLLWYLS